MDINQVLDIISQTANAEVAHLTTFQIMRYTKDGRCYRAFVNILDSGGHHRYSCDVTTPDGKWFVFETCSDSIEEVINSIDWNRVDRGEE
jgi:UDP-glucose 4-epimerase